MPENRTPEGRFLPGQSGNPGGRPKGIAELRELARGHSAEAIEVLVQAMRDEDPRVRIVAAMALLDRAWGKPPQGLAIAVDARPEPDARDARAALLRRLEELINAGPPATAPSAAGAVVEVLAPEAPAAGPQDPGDPDDKALEAIREAMLKQLKESQEEAAKPGEAPRGALRPWP